jgi:trehalose-6-phosphatase
MVHGIYKLVAIVLSNRLKNVIQDLISDNQIAFITGRRM